MMTGVIPQIPALTVESHKTVAMNIHDIEKLYFDKHEDLVRCARILVDDPSTAADVVQEAFVKVLASQPSLHSTDEFSYMKTAVMNQARSALRKRGVSRKHLTSVPIDDYTNVAAPAPTELRIDAQVVSRALASLPRRQRECVALAHTYSMTHNEIGRQLGISEGSVKQHLSRGLAKLSEALKDENNER